MPHFVSRVPEGDDRERSVCSECGYTAYENPKVVVGSVVAVGTAVLLCRRAIEPRHGFWTLPAGYLELGETVEEGAIREAREEACADIAVDGILALYSVSRINQVQIFFRARFVDPSALPLYAAGAESLDVRLFAWENIPWGDLAFPTVTWALQAWRAVGDQALGAPITNPPSDRRGVTPISSVVDHPIRVDAP
jgi:ADP-ribose pyrophosphatase YjhB (NUDIX family)